MRHIMFGNFRIAYEDDVCEYGKMAYAEILDIKTNSNFTVIVHRDGRAHVHNAGQKVSNQETFMKALKRIYEMYDKEEA